MDNQQENKYARLERRILNEHVDVQIALGEFFGTGPDAILMSALEDIILTFEQSGKGRVVTCLRRWRCLFKMDPCPWCERLPLKPHHIRQPHRCTWIE